MEEKELNKIPIKENNERLVDISKFDSRIKIIIPEYMKNTSLKKMLVRKTVAEKLKKIQSELPSNMNLVVTSGLRPLKIQTEIYKVFFKKNKKEHPNWSKEKVREETRKIVAPPDKTPPHSTGGAVDLTVCKDNKPLDMGCSIPMTIATDNPEIHKFPTNSKKITKKQKENRKFFAELMKKYGFVNLESEWWHWSYGDRYWATKKNKRFAIYGSII